MKRVCPVCDFVHGSDWARAWGSRFAGTVTLFVARTAPDAGPRMTRAEAEADECVWRASRRAGESA